MIKLTQASLSERLPNTGDGEFVFVEFNAWLYQGYDDARAALIDVIATSSKRRRSRNSDLGATTDALR